MGYQREQDRSVVAANGQAEYWLTVLEGAGIRYLALDRRTDSRLIELFRSHPDWRADLEDDESVLFVRKLSR